MKELPQAGRRGKVSIGILGVSMLGLLAVLGLAGLVLWKAISFLGLYRDVHDPRILAAIYHHPEDFTETIRKGRGTILSAMSTLSVVGEAGFRHFFDLLILTSAGSILPQDSRLLRGVALPIATGCIISFAVGKLFGDLAIRRQLSLGSPISLRASEVVRELGDYFSQLRLLSLGAAAFAVLLAFLLVVAMINITRTMRASFRKPAIDLSSFE